ncbi:putative membrane protein [Litorivivens lipolytica]|uniref:Protoporphyrinogen IX oxidase n=1 Tax=Litorivivens lipolytica TaxID=1524264 RepID=A0A7W4Z6F8_9GAMM|nr:protoporphyrinogen oxidase HemJ [Litorivivens lipolytica]MBB3048167.1 putative membrane protein [Litorivivens lipolytica]
MLWIKALHIIAMVCWFAGIFYLPRLFVYHTMAEESATREHLKIMERKLYRFISPFAVLTVVFGLILLSQNWSYYLGEVWMQIKLALVAALVAYHLYCGVLVKRFEQDENVRSHVFYRWFNEAPVLVLFGAVILVVVRPL